METVFNAPDIKCDGCANSIKNALGKVAGVESVSVSIPSKAVTVQFDESTTNVEALANELDEIGFPVKEKGPNP
jgi:copper chaperone